MSAPFASVSRTRYQVSRSGKMPEAEKIDDSTWCLPMPIGFPNGSVTYTLCYVLLDGEGGVHLIDPGADSDENRRRLQSFLTSVGLGAAPVRSCVATHMHADHLGLAYRLRQEGVPVLMNGREAQHITLSASFPDEETLERWSVPPARRAGLRQDRSVRATRADPTVADRYLEDGDALPIPGRRIKVVTTPGHTPGSICLVERYRALVFTGDHLLPNVHPGVGFWAPGEENPLSEYLRSLRRTSELDEYVACPGHGYRFRGIARRGESIAAHHHARTLHIGALLEVSADARVWEIAERVAWTAGWERLSGPRLAAALAQTEMHLDRVRGWTSLAEEDRDDSVRVSHA